MPHTQALDQVARLFKFLRESERARQTVIRQLDQYDLAPLELWSLPRHQYVEVADWLNLDAAGDPEAKASHDASDPIVSVTRPPFETAPSPPETIAPWIAGGWHRVRDEPALLERSPRSSEQGEPQTDAGGRARDGQLTLTERTFPAHEAQSTESGDPDGEGEHDGLTPEEREAIFDEWIERWHRWRDREAAAQEVRRVFNRLYDFHTRLKREPESKQLYLSDAVVRLTKRRTRVEHPVLRQRVELNFESKTPKFTVTFADDPAELNTALIREVQGESASDAAEFDQRMRHEPLDLASRDEVKELMQRLIHSTFSHGRVIESNEDPFGHDGPTIQLQQHLLLAPPAERVVEAIDQFIGHLEEAQTLPKSIERLIGLDTDAAGEPEDLSTQAPTLSTHGVPNATDTQGSFLLTKEANEAQRQIIQRLGANAGVCVQGPPGTGKTHTIANIVGHLLAEGKRVLITSHTPKALRVLRDQIVEPLRPLCLSLLESDAESKKQLEQSVHRITDRFQKDDPGQLERRNETLTKQRERCLETITNLEHDLREALRCDYEDVVIGGESFHPIDAAKQLHQRLEQDDWLPGPLSRGVSLPLDKSDIRRLYQLNAELSEGDERLCNLLGGQVANLVTPDEFRRWTEREANADDPQSTIPDRYIKGALSQDLEQIEETWQDTKKRLQPIRRAQEQNERWRLDCFESGLIGGERRALWEDLIGTLEAARKSIGEQELRVTRKMVVLHADWSNDRLQRHLSILLRIWQRFPLAGWLAVWAWPVWRRLRELTEVDGHRPRSLDEWRDVEALVHLRCNRERLARRWRYQMMPYGKLADVKLGHKPEDTVRQYVQAFQAALNWHPEQWAPVRSQIESLGLDWTTLEREAPLAEGEFSSLRQLLQITDSGVRKLLSMRKMELDHQRIDDNLQTMAQAVGRAKEGAVDTRLEALGRAIRDRNADQYQAVYAQIVGALDSLDRVRERAPLIDALREHAPEWAARIERRDSPHEGPEPPGDIEAAWQYRQFAEELDRRDDFNPGASQAKLDEAHAQLRDCTIQLADARAWLKQHERTGLKEQRALTGWSQTVNRRGFEQGKRARRLQNEARNQLREARSAVPIWIMPLRRVIEALDFRNATFDVVILDEASQCDLLGLLALGIAKKVIVVGDDKQVSPTGAGTAAASQDRLIDEYLYDLPEKQLFDRRQSVYDLATRTFGGVVRLTEHFRCAEDIIQFSNHLSYGGEIEPLRDVSDVGTRPFCVAHRVADGVRTGHVNEREAREIVRLIAACIEQPEYEGMTFGIIAMIGQDQQVRCIEQLLQNHLSAQDMEERKILCGTSPHFQGDERDVMFLSLIDSADDGPLRLMRNSDTEKRFNVAASRARNQLWVVHSLRPEIDLKPGDLRKRLIEHALNPGASGFADDQAAEAAESEFERRVLEQLTGYGYRVRPQYKVGRYRIDIVVIGNGDRKIAIECDGDRHHTLENLDEDLQRQAILERLGWRFIRIRGGEYFRDQDKVFQRVRSKLSDSGIEPIGAGSDSPPEYGSEELRKRVIRRSEQLRAQWANDERWVEDDVDDESMRIE